MDIQTISIKVNEKETVSGILSKPENSKKERGIGVIIAHGAGNDMHNPLLVSFANGLTESGCICLRFNFPYKEKGRTSPDRPALLSETWLSAYSFLKHVLCCSSKSIIAAGKSMGGRIASEMVADKILPVDRLIFLGYPLHAPGRKDKLRDAHLYGIDIPLLFFAGTRDPLCDLKHLRRVLKKVNTTWDLEVIEGGDHSLDMPKNATRTDQETVTAIVQKALDWIAR